MNDSSDCAVPTGFVSGAPRIAFDRMGEGETMLFLHGIGGNRTNWRDQLPIFAKTCRAVAWDARGYGASDDYEGPLDFGDFARDIVRLLDYLDTETAHLVGLSMGGRIALDFVACFPDRAASLTLSGTRASFAQRTEDERETFLRLRKKPLVEDGKTPADIAPTVALRTDSYVKTIDASTYYDRSAALEAIRVPTLLVYGGDDRLNSPALGREIAGQIAGARFVEIPDAGHLCNIEAPAEFNSAVLDFLQSL